MEDQAVIDVLHTIIDVLAGRRNLPPHEADALHDSLTPGYTIPAPSDSDVKAAEALLARAGITGVGQGTAPVPVPDPATTPGADTPAAPAPPAS